MTDETTERAIVAELMKTNESRRACYIACITDLDILMTPVCTGAAAALDDVELVSRHPLELDTLRPTESRSET
jgi:hypothetical protein